MYEVLIDLKQPDKHVPDFSTRAEVATELGIAKSTLYDLEELGVFKYKWLGNKRIILRKDIAAIITDNNAYKKR